MGNGAPEGKGGRSLPPTCGVTAQRADVPGGAAGGAGGEGSGLPRQSSDSLAHIKPPSRGRFPKAGMLRGGICLLGLAPCFVI